MSVNEANKQLDYLSEYMNVRITIAFTEPNRWGGFFHNGKYFWNAKYQLPTFEYYVKNCIKDKGGKYDFTRGRWNTGIYPSWMGTTYKLN